jgi:hypothetical protein
MVSACEDSDESSESDDSPWLSGASGSLLSWLEDEEDFSEEDPAKISPPSTLHPDDASTMRQTIKSAVIPL